MTTVKFNPADDAVCAEFRKYTEQAELPYRAHFHCAPPEPAYVENAVAETLHEYRSRLVNNLARATSLAKTDLSNIAKDDALLNRYEGRVLAEAKDAMHHLPILFEIKTTDSSGREATEFIGDKRSWMRQFQPQSTEKMVGICINGRRMNF